jgi:type VI protein secretion system component VasF
VLAYALVFFSDLLSVRKYNVQPTNGNRYFILSLGKMALYGKEMGMRDSLIISKYVENIGRIRSSRKLGFSTLWKVTLFIYHDPKRKVFWVFFGGGCLFFAVLGFELWTYTLSHSTNTFLC